MSISMPDRYQGLYVQRYRKEDWPLDAEFHFGDFVMTPHAKSLRTVVGVGMILATKEFIYVSIPGVFEGASLHSLADTMMGQVHCRTELIHVSKDSVLWTMNQAQEIVAVDVDVDGADLSKLPRRRATDLSNTEVIQLDKLISELDDVMVSVTNLRARLITFKEQHG